MGIALKNPIIVGANNMLKNIDKVKRIEEAGAAAIVYKSLFEEQIILEKIQLQDEIEEYSERHAEMTSIHPNMEHAGPEQHLLELKKIRQAVDIPVIASLNAINDDVWIEYSKKIEETGVDGIEFNFYYVPADFKKSGEDIENSQIEIIQKVKKEISIPISVKLSHFYSNILNFISRLDKQGMEGFVIFNRLIQPDIDTDALKHVYPFRLSDPGDIKLPLRFTGLLFGNIIGDVCSSGGIYDGNDVAKMLLAGASCVQSVSSIYKNGIEHISVMLEGLKSWMDKNGFSSIKDFKGLLAKKNIKDPYAYQRAQYVDILINGEEILKKGYTV
jgi:dihydroorotate dehydrogenase (fumarate)